MFNEIHHLRCVGRETDIFSWWSYHYVRTCCKSYRIISRCCWRSYRWSDTSWCCWKSYWMEWRHDASRHDAAEDRTGWSYTSRCWWRSYRMELHVTMLVKIVQGGSYTSRCYCLVGGAMSGWCFVVAQNGEHILLRATLGPEAHFSKSEWT